MPRIQCFDAGWTFREGGLNTPFDNGLSRVNQVSKAPCGKGAADPSDPAVGFTAVSIPHDFVINGTPDKNEGRHWSFLHHGEGCYRKTFYLPAEYENKRVTILFEGVMSRSKVWVNGIPAASCESGYTPFEVDITDYANFGGNNLITVHADASQVEGWWYGGGGIYRHTWLNVYDPLAVELWGIWVRTEHLSDDHWHICIESTIRSAARVSLSAPVKTNIFSPDGDLVRTSDTSVTVGPFDSSVIKTEFDIMSPELWDVESPKQYACTVTVGEDESNAKFGFRDAVFTKDGFFLNGRKLLMKGVNCHEDYGVSGIAVPDRVFRYRTKLMQEMGANAYRASHNTASSVQLDACDELGVLVMEETRRFLTSPDMMTLHETMIKRDRNRPSIVIWSIGNEEEALQGTPSGRRIADKLVAAMHRLDPSRPVTVAIDGHFFSGQMMESPDVIGINYRTSIYDQLRTRYPDKPYVSTECVAAGTTRGFYYDDDPAQGYYSAYDHTTNCFCATREDTWRCMQQHPWICGMFVWDGFEHRGETNWPRLCSQSGCVDMFFQRKDAFYQHKSHWTDRPMAHILPHWNHIGREGELIRVCVYTNVEKIELFLNGESLGCKDVPKFGYPEWQVAYRPGKLIAVGYQNGKQVVEEFVETTDAPVKIALRLRDAEPDGSLKPGDCIIADCICLDANEREVPDAVCEVDFNCENASLLGTGSDVCDHIPPYVPHRRMRCGAIHVAAKAGGIGTATIHAFAPGLGSATLNIEIHR